MVAESIKEFGWRQAIVVDSDNVIIAGHTRLKAARILGLNEVPITVADDLTPEQVAAYRLADNKTAEASSWEDMMLREELDHIASIDMSRFGFDLSELDFDAAPDVYEKELTMTRRTFVLVVAEDDAIQDVWDALRPITDTEGIRIDSTEKLFDE